MDVVVAQRDVADWGHLSLFAAQCPPGEAQITSGRLLF